MRRSRRSRPLTSTRRRTLELPESYDALAVAAATAAPIADPSFRRGPGLLQRAAHTPEGPGWIEIRQLGAAVEAEARGPGAQWLLDSLPAWVGAGDDDSGLFAPETEPLCTLLRRFGPTRVGANLRLFATLVPLVIAQKVVGKEAGRSYRRLLARCSQTAPDHEDLLLPPAAGDLRALGYEDFHPLGVERRRAETVLRLARSAGRIDALTTNTSSEVQRILETVPGIGPWTSGRAAFAALGDPDAVWTGDYHLPSLVSWNLRGERTATDDDMLELLEPYRGHRARVLLLLQRHGNAAPRRGPRMPFREIDRQ